MDVGRRGLLAAMPGAALFSVMGVPANAAFFAPGDADRAVFYGGFDMSRMPDKQGAALERADIITAIAMLGGIPIFCARYFSGVAHKRTLCSPADVQRLGKYGIRLLPIARQTSQLAASVVNAREQARFNVSEYLKILQSANPHLLQFIGNAQTSQQLKPIRFYLDVEGHSFSSDYYLAWATEIRAAQNHSANVYKIRFSPAIYMNVLDAGPGSQYGAQYSVALQRIKSEHDDLCDGMWWARYPISKPHNLINCRPLNHDLDSAFASVLNRSDFPRPLLMQYAENCAGMDISKIYGDPKLQFDTFSPTNRSLESPDDVIA